MRRVLVSVVVLLGAAAVLLIALTSAPSTTRGSSGPTPTTASRAAAQSVFHVDCRTSPGGDGTRARPWSALASIAEHGSFLPGDRILLARGSVCSGSLTPAGDGTTQRPIVVGAYGDGPAPLVQGGGTADQTGAVQLRDVQHWIIQDLTVTNRPSSPDGSYRSGIQVINSVGGRLNGITIRRTTVSDVASDPGWRDGRDPHEFGGISVVTKSQDASAGFDDVKIVDNVVERVGRVGIVSWNGSYPSSFDHNVTIAENSVVQAEGDSILMYGTDGGAISENLSANGGNLTPCGACRSDPGNTASAGIWPTRARNIVVEANEVYGEHASRGDGQGLDIDIETQGILVHRNYVHDNEGGGALICGALDATIRANIFQNNGYAAFVFNCSKPSMNVDISNNDVFSSASHPADIVRTVTGRGAASLRFVNNIVQVDRPARWDWPGAVVTADNTLLAPRQADSADGRASILSAIGTGAVGRNTLNGYRPSTGSIGRSTPVADTAVDFFGTPYNPTSPGRGAVVTPPAK